MNGLSTYYVILIVVCLAGAAYLYIKRRKAASTSSSASAPAATSVAAKIDAAVVDLKTHVESTVANAAESIKTRVATVGAATVSKITGQPVGVAIVGTANAPAPVPAAQPAAPSPAAPAPSAAAEPPPTTVVPAAPPAAPAPSAGSSGADTWPHLIVVDGLNIMADAPINADWKADAEAKSFTNIRHFLGDPSNGDKCVPPQPLRSPAGYPLFYALGAGNAPQGAPSVVYNGNSFPDDAAVADYIAAVANARVADDAAAHLAASQVFAGPVPLSVLGKDDLRFLWWAICNAQTPKMHNWHFVVLSGSRTAIQQELASVSADIAWLRTYDPTKYQGVLRPYYDEAVKA